MSGLINPANFVVKAEDLDSGLIREAGTAATSLGASLDSATDEIQRAWSGLQQCYEAPEQERVYRLMMPATTAADQIRERMDQAARATRTYATAVTMIRSRLRMLESEAAQFRALALQGHDRWGYQPIVINGPVRTTIPHWGPIHEEWYEHTPYVERNAALLRTYDELMTSLAEAASTCSSDLTALMSPTAAAEFRTMVAEAEHQAIENAEKNPPKPPAWGYPREESRTSLEQIWDGGGTFLSGLVLGPAGLVGINPETGPGDGELAARSWLSLLDVVGSLALTSSDSTMATALYLGQDNPAVAKFILDRYRTSQQVAGGFIAVDPSADDPYALWKNAPVQASTETVLNIGSMFVGGAGTGRALATAVTSTTRGARFANALAHTVQVKIPGGAWLTRSAVQVYRVTHLDFSGLRSTKVPFETHVPNTLPGGAKAPVSNEIFPQTTKTPGTQTGGGGYGGGGHNPPVAPHPASPGSPTSPSTPTAPEATTVPATTVRPAGTPADYPVNGPVHGGPGRHANAVYEYTTGSSRPMNTFVDDLGNLSPAQARQLLDGHGDSLPPWVREQVESVASRTGTGGGLENFNPETMARTANQVDSLIDVIDNKPPVTGPVSTGQWVDETTAAGLQPGSTYSPGGFFSSTVDEKTALAYAAGASDEGLQSVVFRVESRTGVSMEGISSSTEVLFRPGTRFEVVSRGPLSTAGIDPLVAWKLGDNPLEIVLREVP